MVETKPIEEVRQKWKDSHGRVATNYSSGVQRASNVIQKAIDAEDLYAQKMQDAISRKARAKGLAGVSDADWKKAATEKGSRRIASGMAASEDKFVKGMAQNLATIQGVQIAPRTADPIANVDNRVKPIVAALHNQKMSQ